MKKLFQNAHLFDPANSMDGPGELLVEGEKILDVAIGGFGKVQADQTIDIKGMYLFPGFIDIHVHFREPGGEYKEDFQSGSRSAAAGGYTTVCPMANTNPVNDNQMISKMLMDRANEKSLVRIHPIGAVSKGLRGEEMAEYFGMLEAGCVGFSDDGKCVMNSLLARRAMEYIKDLNVPYIEHCEDHVLSQNGAMNEGLCSFDLGVQGIPNASEDVMVLRDIELGRLTGAHLHVAHLSSRFSLGAIKRAKEDGLRVTTEVTPHHLFLTDEALRGCNTDFKMAPPLRSEADCEALLSALEEGIIEAIATDHAPHSEKDKNNDFEFCCNGVIGLETAFPVLMKLVERKKLSLKTVIKSLTSGPAKIMGFSDRGELKKGRLADFAVFDMNRKHKINKLKFHSKSRNTPFDGWYVSAETISTYLGGKPVFDKGRFC